MDSSPAPTTPLQQEEDEWDNDDFVIPDLGIGGGGGDSIPVEKKDDSVLETTTSPSHSPKVRKEESIYLGPHGAPPSQSKQPPPGGIQNSSSRKQLFKQKLKEADKRISGTGRENKLENLKELVGGGKLLSPTTNMSKASSRDWLDPHCHESQFDKRNSQ